jgi:septal ring-binding cell division protein DamX
VIVLTVLVVGCGGAAATQAPRASTGGAQPSAAALTTPGAAATAVSAGTPANPGGAPAGDVKSLVKSLIPTASTQLSETQIGGNYTVQLSSQSPLSDVESFYDQKLPTVGVTPTGKTSASGTTVYAFTNPDGGITITPDGNGGLLIIISAGASG